MCLSNDAATPITTELVEWADLIFVMESEHKAKLSARGERLNFIDRLAMAAIDTYKRHVSPYKGFCCAYRVHTGCASCSTLGLRAIRRYGLWDGLPLLRRRLRRCAVAHKRFAHGPIHLRRQGGYCDFSCDLPCTGIDVDTAGTACDGLSGCGGCDCGSWGGSRKSSEEEKYVYIPPDTSRHRPPAQAQD